MHQDFLDLLRAFIDGNVRFLIVGAYALAVHGRPRATGDLDVWVDPTPENAAKLEMFLKGLESRVRLTQLHEQIAQLLIVLLRVG